MGLVEIVGLLLSSFVFAADVSCECPKLDCGPCHEEQGLTFYSEKCGPGGNQTKSCARPTCVIKADAPPTCQAQNSPEKPAAPAATRAIASEIAKKRGPEIAMVKGVVGSATVRLPDGSEQPLNEGFKIHEGDSIRTSADGKVQLEFKDGNLMQVQNDSAIRIDEYEMAAEKRKAVIDLLRGQLRNQVKQKYNGETSTYQVKTKTAVAGVRGTDFLVKYSTGERIETTVQTLEGQVILANQDYTESVPVAQGQQASYVVAANVFAEEELNEFVARGYMTPVHNLKASEIARLNEGTWMKPSRGLAQAAKKVICAQPAAELNQCAWRCVNNPAGAKACRMDLPEVSCMRRRCNANGEWAEETRLPASLKEQCAPSGEKVAPCDY